MQYFLFLSGLGYVCYLSCLSHLGCLGHKRLVSKSKFMAVRSIIFISIILLPLFLLSHHAYAQFGNVAYTYTVSDKDAVEGDLLSIGDKPDQLVRTTTDNQDRLFGVIVNEPVIVFRTASDKTPIVRSGETTIGVSTVNGSIKRGDLLVASKIPGKAQKYTQGTGGKLVGNALEDFTQKEGILLRPDSTVTTQGQAKQTVDGKEVYVGKISVALNIGGTIRVNEDEPVGWWIFKGTGGGFLSTGNIPKNVELMLRFLFAALVAITSIFISFRNFGKNISKGIEAMGRNPLAHLQIQSMMMVNVVLTLAVAVLGLFLAIVIIKF